MEFVGILNGNDTDSCSGVNPDLLLLLLQRNLDWN